MIMLNRTQPIHLVLARAVIYCYARLAPQFCDIMLEGLSKIEGSE